MTISRPCFESVAASVVLAIHCDLCGENSKAVEVIAFGGQTMCAGCNHMMISTYGKNWDWELYLLELRKRQLGDFYLTKAEILDGLDDY